VFDPEYTKALDELTAQAGNGDVTLAPNANEIIDRDYVPEARPFVHALFKEVKENPREVVRNTVFLNLVRKGVILEPKFDPNTVRRFLALSRRAKIVLGDERFQVMLLTPDELREVRAEGRLQS
jgi:hypothetical protein